GRLSVERRRGRDRSRGGFGQTTRVRPRQAGKAQRGWRAGARTRPHLGSAHLPGFVQEGAVIDAKRRKHMSNNNGQKLARKIAVITGGNSGIGLATAKRFVEEGAHVVITGRREKELKEAAAFIKRNVATVTGDITRLEDLDRLYALVKEKHGHIDALFANAGWGEVAPIETATEAHFDKTFDLNAKGTFFTVQKAIPLFKNGGSIILTTSVANVMGLPTFAVYAASKAAVRSFVRSWAMELKDRNI